MSLVNIAPSAHNRRSSLGVTAVVANEKHKNFWRKIILTCITWGWFPCCKYSHCGWYQTTNNLASFLQIIWYLTIGPPQAAQISSNSALRDAQSNKFELKEESFGRLLSMWKDQSLWNYLSLCYRYYFVVLKMLFWLYDLSFSFLST